MFQNFKLKRKREVLNEDFIKLTLDDLNICEDFVEEMKSKWFNVNVKVAYKDDLFKTILPSLKKFKEKSDKEIVDIRNKYSKLLDKEKNKIMKVFLKEE